MGSKHSSVFIGESFLIGFKPHVHCTIVPSIRGSSVNKLESIIELVGLLHRDRSGPSSVRSDSKRARNTSIMSPHDVSCSGGEIRVVAIVNLTLSQDGLVNGYPCVRQG